MGGGVGSLNAFSPIKAKIEAGAADVIINSVSDSTGNAGDEFLYLWFAAVAAQYPTHSFEYYPSNSPAGPVTDGGYGTKIDISTGSGARKVKFYNNAIAGEQIMFPMGSLFPTAFPETPDLVLWNMGKNQVAGYTAALNLPVPMGEFVAAFAQVQDAFPNAQQVAIRQYPNRDDTNMAVMENAWALISTFFPELLLIDFYTPSYVSGDYADNVHFTAAANLAKLLPIIMAAWNGSRAGSFAPAAPFMATQATNQMDDDAVNYGTRSGVRGDFNDAANGTSVPVGYSNNGAAVFANELSLVVAPRTKALSIAGSGAASPRISRVIPAARIAAMAGQYVTLIVQQYIDPGSNSTVGRVLLGYTSPTTNGGSAVASTTRAHIKARGAYRYSVVGPVFIPADVTAMSVTLNFDSAASPDTEPVIYQKAVLAIGKAPRNTL